MIYILDHYYAINHSEFCIIVESQKRVDEIVEICSAIAFLLEDMFDVSVSLDMNCLLNVLTAYYGAKDRKKDVPFEVLESLGMPIDGIFEDTFASDGVGVYKAYIVDLYEAREYCCGDRYREIMEKWLPKGEQLQQLKALLRESGVEK